MKEFELDPRLAGDTIHVTDLPLSRVLLMNDKHYPWFILVPRQAGLTELHQLDSEAQQQLQAESNRLSLFLEAQFQPETLNVAALGNVVRQLHIHHIARFTDDPCWPQPIWGKYPVQAYPAEQAQTLAQQCREFLLST
ncbi:MAG: HIT domain-containing protein [Glaciecola sp.]|jgi:diadenosine tetraphosphate (Ap4A) HIT family hydrolase